MCIVVNVRWRRKAAATRFFRSLLEIKSGQRQGPMFFFLEYCLVAMSIAGAYFLRSFPSGWFDVAERHLGRLACRRTLSVLAVGALALLVRVALLPNEPVPQPGFHDEFGYLLMGDTFAHGRLANPTHPMWIHFESIYINQRPTYGGMYFPAQGLLLALGQVIGQRPFVSVWLCGGVMCAAICWMLQGWLPPGWALLGGLLAVIRLGSFSYWVDSYQVGALPAIGGALVLGSLPRLKRHWRTRDALILGLGVAILAGTRPYESLFFCLPVGVALLAWMLGTKRPPFRQSLLRIVLPLGLLLTTVVCGMGYYFWRTTGNPFRAPSMVYTETYSSVPVFPWQPLNLKHVYHHAVIEKFFLHEWPRYLYYHARRAPLEVLGWKASDFYRFYLGPVLAMPIVLLMALKPLRFLRKAVRGKTGFLLAVCGASFVGLALPIYFLPHYAAPLTAAVYALVLQAMRYLRLWRWRGRRTGLGLVQAIPVICVLLFVLRGFAPQLHIPTPVEWHHTWDSEHYQNLDRARAAERLEGLEGDRLVFVRYNQYHNSDNEWVYNRADIDRAKVVWARDMGNSGNAELIRYFPHRQLWLAEPDLAPPRLTPYPFLPAQTAQPPQGKEAPQGTHPSPGMQAGDAALRKMRNTKGRCGFDRGSHVDDKAWHS